MNKRKNDNWRTLHILLVFFVVMLALLIYAIYDFKIYNESVERQEEYVKDNKYKVVLEQVVKDGIFVPSRTRVVVGKNIENEWIYKNLFEMSYKVRGSITKDNCIITWIDGGVIIKVTEIEEEEEKDMTYRVYWEDVF